MKKCRECEIPKPETEFYRSGKGGRDTVCGECRREERRLRKTKPKKDPFNFVFGGGI